MSFRKTRLVLDRGCHSGFPFKAIFHDKHTFPQNVPRSQLNMFIKKTKQKQQQQKPT